MKVNELTQYPEFTCVNESALSDKENECGYVGDLLSWVMGNADAGCAWVTIQTHVNIVAVAVLVEMSCIIIPELAELEEETVVKATEEGIPIFQTPKNAFEICAWLGAQGIK